MKLKLILIESEEESDIFRKKGSNLLEYVSNNNYQGAYLGYDILLMNLEKEIIEGDMYCVRHNIEGEILSSKWIVSKADKNFITSYFIKEKKDWWYKIISSTNKSHNLSQLSEQSIKLLIDYYNENKCMPESIEIECDTEPVQDGNWEKYSTIKLNQQSEIDMVVPEIKEKLYTENEVQDLIFLHHDWIFNELRAHRRKSFTCNSGEWFTSKKK